jgi:hypothetical protein
MGETRPQPDARAAAWLAAKNRGATFDEIGRRAGLTANRVRQVVLTHPDYVCAIRPYAPPHDEAFIAKVRCLREQGLSMSAVGERLGVSKGTVVGICSRHFKAEQRES